MLAYNHSSLTALNKNAYSKMHSLTEMRTSSSTDRYPSPFLHALESMYLQATSPHTTDSSIHFQLDFRPTPPTMTSHSPNRSTDPTLQVRIKQALEARFILFCQPTPNSFVILSTGLHEGTNSDIRDGDFKSPSSIRHSLTTAHQARKRYRIVIGPQACSCEETMEKVCRPVRNTDRALRPCVHVLFIMLRVLRTPVDDACLTQVPLPATKVEGLLQSYTNFKNTLNQRRAPEQKCHLALVPSTSEPKPITQRSNSSLMKPAKASSPPVPLAMPKPIYPLTKSQIPAPSEKTPHLLALVNATIQNSSECGELSSLTKGIMPVSRRREIESAGAVESSNTGTTVSRTSSSSDSTGSPRIRPPRRLGSMGDKYNSCWSAVAGTDSRRPRTAPQPDPPSCVGPRRIRSVRDGISATFRPIRDYSPTRLRENRLTPIKSEEVSADESLKYHLTCEISGEYESLRQAPDTKDISQSEPVPINGGFKHLHHGPFQPVAKKTSQPDRANGLAKTSNINNGAGTNSATKSPEDESLAILQSPSQFTGCVQRMCSLCLQNWEDCQGEKAERLVRCCATEILESSCVATFHFSCCKAWLEEISNTDGIPHCPICLSAWETTPFEDMTLEKCSSARQLVQKACSPENSSSVCPCQALRSIMNESAQTFSRGDEDTERNEKTCSPLVRHSTPRSSPPYPEYENCIAAFSQEIADGIASEHCVTARQLALQQAAQLTVRRIILIRQQHKIQTTADSSSDAVVKHGPVLDRSQKVPPNNSSAPQIQPPSEPDCLRVMFRLIQHLFDDPVDSIFIDALRAFRELLGFLVCFNAETQMALQRAIGPILRRLLRFVGGASVLWTLRNHAIGTGDGLPNRTSILTRQASIDSTEISSCSNPHFATEKQAKKTSEKGSVDAAAPVNVATEERGSGVDSRTMHETVPPPLANLRDRANLALATLVELAKGQSGALAVGRDVGCASQCLPVCGLQHMTRFILSSAKFHATHLIGRLTLLDKLIRMDQTQLTLSSSLSTGPGSVNCAESRLRSGAKPFPTETSKQAAQQSQHQQQQQQSCPQNGPDFLARRHLCSSLVFARRHLLPPTPNPALAVCFPSYYQAQPLPSSSSSSSMLTSGNELVAKPVLINSIEHQNQAVDSLYNTQLKASRVARRVFLTASRSLLTYNERHPNERSNLLNSNQKTSAYGGREFCPREFVEVEINRTEAPLAAWLRNKLAPLLYPNLIPGLDAPLLPIRMTVSEAPPGVPPRGQSQQPNLDRGRQMITTSRTIGDISVTSREDRSKRSVLTPSPDRVAQSPSCPPSPPPVPPPRRCAGLRSASEIRPQRSCKRPNERGNEGILPAVHSSSPISSQYVAVALEPAYDLVALSESGNYNTVSEGEEEDAAEDDPCEQKGGDNNDFPPEEAAEPTYGGRSLGSEAELQTEQAAVLRCALRRCSRSLRPLLPVPALTIVMDAFRNTHKLPSTDEYYESVDWVRGPILGHGAFSQCYQARDTRTGLLMAVKRIRLGGGSVFPIVTDKSKPQPRTERFLEPPLDKTHLKNKAEQCNPDKDDKTERDPTRPLSPASASQLTEVQAEVDTMLRLSHPNVLRLFGAVYCARRGLVDLFIEWMPGGSITGLLHQYGAFNEPVTLAYGVQVIRGLAYLHKHGILHRDLKGANLLVDTTGSVVRISDFGASARLSGEKSVAGQFRGQVIGTFSFMAPEVLRGQAYGRACDIWSVGCCLIEMLTSKPPWHDRRLTNRYALIYEIATSDSPPPYPESVDENIVTVLDSCFARNPSERPTASKLLTFRAFAKLTEPHNVFTSHSMRRLCDPCVYAEGQAVKRPVWDGSSTGSGTLPTTSRVAEVDLKQIQKPEWPFSHSTTRVA